MIEIGLEVSFRRAVGAGPRDTFRRVARKTDTDSFFALGRSAASAAAFDGGPPWRG